MVSSDDSGVAATHTLSSDLEMEPGIARVHSTSLSCGGGGGGGGGGTEIMGTSAGKGGGGGGMRGGWNGEKGGKLRGAGDLEVPGDCFGFASVGVRTGLSSGDGPVPRSTWNPASAIGVSIEEGIFAGGDVFSPVILTS